MPALIISILISDAPFVAGGYAFKDIQGITLTQIINGDVRLIYGNYLQNYNLRRYFDNSMWVFVHMLKS